MSSNIILAIAGWVGLNICVQSLVMPSDVRGQAQPSTSAAVQLSSANAPIPDVNLASIQAVRPSSKLPGGPDGGALPPGSIAPDRSFKNNYAWGQCTWYVASRKQVPSTWRNARNWYYNAMASGWKVGATPAVAAIAWTSAGTYGHVALVEQISTDGKRVYISEMNYRGVGVKSFRWVSASNFKYIY